MNTGTRAINLNRFLNFKPGHINMKRNSEEIRFSNNRSTKDKLPYFRFGLQGDTAAAISLLSRYPMQARHVNIRNAQVKAVNTILSNIPIGNKLAVRNFSNLTKRQRGFSRRILLKAFDHLKGIGLLDRDGEGFSSSEIIFSNKIKKYIPEQILYCPESTIFINKNGEERKVAEINTKERRELNNRLKEWWKFIKQHDIAPGLTTNDFEVFNKCETEVFGKRPLIKPSRSDILPYIVFNDRDLTKGGRMYGAFWIGMKKELRRGIRIDGSETSDIDGKGMHVQLLYQEAGEPLPEGDIYLYSDDRRKITKGLMLLMMNTKSEVSPEMGRKQVKMTYKNRFGHDEGLDEYILELEGFHYKIMPFLYKPNWGQLQKTEAAIMLNIMEAAMNEDIVVLPVHDGCICKLEHKEKVLQLFKEQGIEAEENRKHLLPVPLEEKKKLLEAFYAYREVA